MKRKQPKFPKTIYAIVFSGNRYRRRRRLGSCIHVEASVNVKDSLNDSENGDKVATYKLVVVRTVKKKTELI